VRVLHQGEGNFVLGNDYSPWHKPEEVLPIMSGEDRNQNPEYAWDLLRSPLPTVDSTEDPAARRLYSAIRGDLGLSDKQYEAGGYIELTPDTREDLEIILEGDTAGTTFFQRENPFVRHVVLRKRTALEDAGLLEKVGVNIHPEVNLVKNVNTFNALFEGLALRTTDDFNEAYEGAREFGRALGRSGGFMKNLMEQRICSSIVAGISTAKKLIEGHTIHEETDDHEYDLVLNTTDGGDELFALESLLYKLQQIDQDPKLNAVLHYLDEESWLSHGVIIFSQYYDTAKWMAEELAQHFPNEAVGLYAGAGKSKLYQKGESVGIDREVLKRMVADHQLNILVATDAACEGLNLQTLGALINIDLPWNPTKLEQRIGRIKRFGQVRDNVDMLNLVNAGTVDEKVYERLSERMKDRYDIFGGLPDTIRDEWIEDIETLGEKMDEYIKTQKTANGFDLRYNTSLEPSNKDWRDCSQVLSRRDFVSLMSESWNGVTFRQPAQQGDLLK
jgi:hypothetical protein